jgi:DNA (cytosine-5)-methyltransferase 1
MKYLSVCSGIEAATVAWHPLGWSPVAFAEIEKFPSAVLAHHYPSVPNLGDMTKFKDWPDADVDVLVGGTPCQSFSVAGLRQGLADPRGNLCLTFLAIADKYRPEWLLWENVPGVLSSDGGRDFGAFLGGLGQLGYGWSYRVLDAQYVRVDGFGRAVPQRRRRVFVVGNLRDWRRSAAVLFERESLQGNIAPRRQAGERVAPTISARPSGGGGLGTDFDCDGGLIPAIANPLTARMHKGINTTMDEGQTMVAHALRGEGFDAGEDGTGRGTPLVPIAFDTTQITSKANRSVPKAGDPCHPLAAGAHAPCIAFSAKDHGGDAVDGLSPTLRAGGFTGSHANAGVMPAIAFQPRFVRNDRGGPSEIAYPLTAEAGRTGKGDSAQCVATNWAVRRLTPKECERLQGFPDGYTDVPWRKKNWTPDGPRYKGLGNSMAVNVMRWIGRRIALVSTLSSQDASNPR